MNHHQQHSQAHPPRFCGLTRIYLHVVCAWLCLVVVRAACAEEESGSLTFPEEPAAGTLSFPETESNFVDRTLIPSKDDVEHATGVDGRIGFIGLPAFGRDDSIVPVELFPYVQTENRIFFGDFRGFISTAGNVGGNAGLGMRFIDPSDTALFGVNAFYDADDSTGRVFQQMSVGWEARLEKIGLFGNIYMPVGAKEKIIKQSIYNERFDEHNILFDVRNRIGKAMTGLDINLQAYLPGDFLESHQVQASAGWYHFQGFSGVDTVNGFKVQLQGNIIPSIGTLTSLTNDNMYGTNFNIGVFWRFGSRDLPGTSLHGQLRRFVDRNYNVILARQTMVDTGIVAHKADGTELIVQHVGNNTAGTGTGTNADPYTSINAAQGAALHPDLIFVHSGAVLNDTVVLGDGQTLLGEGTAAQFRDYRYGMFNVPGGTSTGATPQISGSLGDAVTMGNNSQIAGILIKDSVGRGIVAENVDNVKISKVTIDNSGGDAVYVDGITNSSISNVTVNGSGGNGISIMNIDDALDLQNIYVEDVAGNGIHIDGGLGTISFTKQLIIQRTALAAFSIENMESLTEVDDKGTTSTLDDQTTITPSLVSVDELVVRNAGGGYGGGISSVDNAGFIGFGAIDVETEGAAGMYSRNDNALLISNGFLNSIDSPVADVEGSSISVALTKITADGGDTGMRFKDSTGSFYVFGDGKNTSSGGVIKNTTVGISMENAGSVGLQTVDFTGNGKMAEVHGGSSLIISGSTVTGTTNMLIDATNLTQLQVLQSTFTDNSLSSSQGIRYQVDTTGSFTASVSNNLATAFSGTFFDVQTLTGGEAASLTYAFQNNAIDLGSYGGGIAASMNWTGPVLAYATNNTIVGTGTSQTGIRIFTGDSAELGQMAVSQNAITFSGVNSTGIDINTQTQVNLIADANTINMNAQNQTAIRAQFSKTSAIAMADNIITDNAGGGTGMLFTSVEDGTQIALDNNTIDLSKFSTYVDRGLIISAFTAADGDPPVVFVSSTASNTISGATTTYALPSSGTRGRLIINDSSVAFP